MIENTGLLLIVEDNMAMLYALQAQFESCGWEVVLAKTVASALTHLDPPPDWIVLDLWLTDGDGEEILSHVRHAGLPCRVAVISAVLDEERLANLRPLKPDLVMTKPISFVQLERACRDGESRRSSRGILERALLELLEPVLPAKSREIQIYAG